MYINRSLRNHGYSNFSLEILEYCKIEDLLKRENHYLKILKPHYNLLKVAYSRLGSLHSKEARKKMSVAGLGKKLTGEHKAKISLSQPNCIKIEVTDFKLNTKTIYHSIKAAARGLKISHKSILKFFKNTQQIPH